MLSLVLDDGSATSTTVIGNEKLLTDLDLNLDYKLIGFKVVTGRDFHGTVASNIRSIAPITDSSNCELAKLNLDPAYAVAIDVLFIGYYLEIKTRELDFAMEIVGGFSEHECEMEVTISP